MSPKAKSSWYWFGNQPSATLHQAVDKLQVLMERRAILKKVADRHSATFRSEGLRTLFAMLRRELDDGYPASVGRHLERLTFRTGVLISAELGRGIKGTRLHTSRAAARHTPLVRETVRLGTGRPDFHAVSARRKRLAGIGRSQRSQAGPCRQRDRPRGRPHQQLLRHAAAGTGLLCRMPQFARAARQTRRTVRSPGSP